MDRPTIEAELQNFFPETSLEDWKKIAAQEAKADDPLRSLAWRGKDNILFLPYYDAASDEELQFIRKFTSQQRAHTQRQWFNLPLVKGYDPVAANASALEHLMNGADGVLCDVRTSSDPQLKVLIDNIEWPHCYIGFYVNENPNFFTDLRDILGSRYIPASVNGALFWEAIPKKVDLAFYFDYSPSFHSLGFIIPASSPADELSNALLQGIDALELFSSSDLETVFRSVAFSLSAEVTLLETIAKFKAMRILWFQIARTYGLVEYRPDDLFIHARSTFVSDGDFGPHENMIKSTFASMGALMGGCDALTVESDENASFAIRCARNVSTILKEESFFDRAVDPMAGAWTVDAMTKAIAEKTWRIFQEKCGSHAKT